MMKFLNKKGDLNLSINAIVILIIAIVFLGLALTFTRNIITGSSDKLIAGVDQVDLQNPANADTPITFDSKFEIKAGDKQNMKISVYNKGSTKFDIAIPFFEDEDATCKPTGLGGKLTIAALESTIESNSEGRFQTIVKVENGVISGNYICTLQIVKKDATSTVYNSIQVPVKITS